MLRKLIFGLSALAILTSSAWADGPCGGGGRLSPSIYYPAPTSTVIASSTTYSTPVVAPSTGYSMPIVVQRIYQPAPATTWVAPRPTYSMPTTVSGIHVPTYQSYPMRTVRSHGSPSRLYHYQMTKFDPNHQPGGRGRN